MCVCFLIHACYCVHTGSRILEGRLGSLGCIYVYKHYAACTHIKYIYTIYTIKHLSGRVGLLGAGKRKKNLRGGVGLLGAGKKPICVADAVCCTNLCCC